MVLDKDIVFWVTFSFDGPCVGVVDAPIACIFSILWVCVIWMICWPGISVW